MPWRLLVDVRFANMKRQKTTKKKQTDSQRVLGKTRLSSDFVTPKDFKPWHFKDCKTEDDVLSVLVNARDAGDSDASFLLDLLGIYSVNDLLVEGLISIEGL